MTFSPINASHLVFKTSLYLKNESPLDILLFRMQKISDQYPNVTVEWTLDKEPTNTNGSHFTIYNSYGILHVYAVGDIVSTGNNQTLMQCSIGMHRTTLFFLLFPLLIILPVGFTASQPFILNLVQVFILSFIVYGLVLLVYFDIRTRISNYIRLLLTTEKILSPLKISY